MSSVPREQKEIRVKTRGNSNSITRRIDEENKLAPLSPVSVKNKSLVGGNTTGRILKPVVPPNKGRDGSHLSAERESGYMSQGPHIFNSGYVS